MIEGHFGQDLSIQDDLLLEKNIDETTVIETDRLQRSRETTAPKRTEISLLHFSASISMHSCVLHCLLS